MRDTTNAVDTAAVTTKDPAGQPADGVYAELVGRLGRRRAATE